MNATAGVVMLVLSLTALLCVLIGFTRPPLPDEGTLAHIFQLAVAALVPAGIAFVATADWTRPAPLVARLAIPAIAVVLAFGALYYLEHVYYAASR